MKQHHWRIAIASILCGVGLFSAGLAVVRLGGRTTYTVARDDGGNVGASAVGLLSAARVDDIAHRAEAAVSAQAAEASLPDADVLSEDVGSILRAWLGGTGDSYLDYLAAAGDSPPPSAVWEDPDRRNKAWLDSTSQLRKSSFNPEQLTIRASVVDGESVPDESARNRVSGSRFDKLSGVDEAFLSPDQIEAAGMNIHEVRVPMRSEGILANTEFDGLLVLSYVRDPKNSRWTLVSVSIYDVPSGDTARTPPF